MCSKHIPNLTSKIKDKIWKDFTKNSSSKDELKQIFLGVNPGESYKKISDKLKTKLNTEVKNISINSPKRKSIRPKILNIIKTDKNVKKLTIGQGCKGHPTLVIHNSPKRKISSPKRKIASPKRKIASPKRKIASPKRKISSPKRKIASPKRTIASSKRTIISPK